jgi:hypothetical protein
MPEYGYAMHALGGNSVESQRALPYGAIVGQVFLDDCVPVERIDATFLGAPRSDGNGCFFCEWSLGNYDPGRFGWVMKDPLMLRNPIPYQGSQGFFEVPEK